MYDLIIIGAGPAGLTAALYAGRARLKTLLLEKMAPGGRILLTESIENLPGFPQGISTHELISRMETQVKDLDVKIELEEAQGLGRKLKTVKTPSKQYFAKSIIIATGARPRKLGCPGEDRLIGKGVSFCATCDAPLYKEKDVIIVGGGNAVAEEALYLARFAKRVTVIHRRNELRASAILQERLKENKKIHFILGNVITEILGVSKVKSIRIKEADSLQEKNISCDGIFIYIGYEPDTGFIKNKIKLDEAGFIITDENLATSIDGVFACGDCRKKSLYQVVTACGDGAVASDSAYKYISKATTYGTKRT
jgi:thioredoxin reductase (NADPH)